MNKSLMLPINPNADLLSHPKGPLQRVEPRSLFSLDALRRAWLKVRGAGGAPGVDGVSIRRFEAELENNLAALQAELLAGRYRPQPVKRLLAPKPGSGLRPLALWALRDRVVQRVVYDCIAPYFERQFLNCSYGFRPGRGVADAVQAVLAQRDAGRRWVADIDIKDCFDSLDSGLVMQFVSEQVKDPTLLRLVRAWLQARVFNALSGPWTPAGAAQGAVISPLLANVYLHQVDLQLAGQRYQLVRYADDVLICCRRKQEAQAALETSRQALGRVKLQLNAHKSRVVHFDQGFQFLGVFFLRNEHFYLK
jgi:RNA-directed DNA polymerase